MMFLQRRGRKGSGDLPGLQSRRFGPSRVEWWIRLPHASATLLKINSYPVAFVPIGTTVLIDWPMRSIASRWLAGIARV